MYIRRIRVQLASLYPQRVPTVNTLHIYDQKINLLMLYKAKVAVCLEINTKHMTQCEYHVNF